MQTDDKGPAHKLNEGITKYANAIKRKVQQIKFSHAKRPANKERHYSGPKHK